MLKILRSTNIREGAEVGRLLRRFGTSGQTQVPVQYTSVRICYLKMYHFLLGCTGFCFCRISGRPDIRLIQKPDIRLGPDIRPDICLDKYIFGKIQNKFNFKSFNNYSLQQTKNKA
jgi:hypothetical protein